ncbi:Hypothetical protein, conserved [Brucella abortus str. 2308 A]|nr:Hypothetical protein, conserved [Brucella abortus str. 2308 A]
MDEITHVFPDCGVQSFECRNHGNVSPRCDQLLGFS